MKEGMQLCKRREKPDGHTLSGRSFPGIVHSSQGWPPLCHTASSSGPLSKNPDVVFLSCTCTFPGPQTGLLGEGQWAERGWWEGWGERDRDTDHPIRDQRPVCQVPQV